MGVITAIAAGAAVAGAATSAYSAKKQGDAADDANALQRQQQNLTAEQFRPYREAGTEALGEYRKNVLEGDSSGFYESPDYQYGLERGQQAIERGSAARGQYFTPRTVSYLQRGAQDYASTRYNSYLDRLSNLTNLGAGATQNAAAMGAQSVNAQSNLLQQAGAAQAGGAMGVGSAITQGLGNYATLSALQQPAAPQAAASPFSGGNYSPTPSPFQ